MNGHLLDTHVLLWWLSEPARLPVAVHEAMSDTTTSVYVSAAAVWEMAIKKSIGRLEMPSDLLDVLADEHIEILPIDARHALGVMELPRIHQDPFNRVQIAQAKLESLTLVTADKRIHQYDAPMWRLNG